MGHKRTPHYLSNMLWTRRQFIPKSFQEVLIKAILHLGFKNRAHLLLVIIQSAPLQQECFCKTS